MSKSLFILSLISLCAITLANPVGHAILDEFVAKGNTKQLFKVWHHLMNKDYDYNTMQGINKYRTFKKNLKQIQEHNAQNGDYQMGLNEMSDMTYEEAKAYYNIAPIDMAAIHKNLRDEMDVEEIKADPWVKDDPWVETDPFVKNDPWVQGCRQGINWTSNFRAIRNQGQCGSCWAYAAAGAVEGNWAILNKRVIQDYLSPQQLVDCERRMSKGCNGGYPSEALNYLKSHYASWDSRYPYKGRQESCSESDSKSSGIRIRSVSFARSEEQLYSGLQRGTFAVALATPQSFMSYRSGVWSDRCTGGTTHIVIAMGQGCSNGVNYWIIRNSWGTYWGQSGYGWVKEDPNNNRSCYVAMYANQPTL